MRKIHLKLSLKCPISKTDLFESKEKYANRVADVVVDSIFNQIQVEWDKMHNFIRRQLRCLRKELLELHETLSALLSEQSRILMLLMGLSITVSNI